MVRRWGRPPVGVKVAVMVTLARAPARVSARRPFLVVLSFSVTVPACTVRAATVATVAPRSRATAPRRPADGTATLTVIAARVVRTIVPRRTGPDDEPCAVP